MLKKWLVLALLTSSVTGFAQTLGERMDRVGNRMEGTFPEVRAPESDEYRLHMGLSGGINNPEDLDSSAEYGINVGFQPWVPFGVAAELTTTELDNFDQDQRTTLLAKGTYNMGGDIPVLRHSWIGAGVGPTVVDDKFEWVVAPTVGFDIPLANKVHDVISLGLNAKYMFVSDNPDSLVAAAAVKYWY